MPGHHLIAGRLVLRARLGRGATGSVWCAWDRVERRHVAVKVPATGSPAAVPPVEHRHVLAATGWATDAGPVTVMELVRGGSLLDLCADTGRLPEAYVAALLDQLLQALAAVHAAGAVHRDVKPANILLDPTGPGRPRLRLADFGDAATIGTPGYLAPERQAGAPAHPSQDVYAAGVLVRRLLDAPGPLTTLASSMSRLDADRRPTAAESLARLRTLPVGRGGPWPVVPDRYASLSRAVRHRGRDSRSA